MATALYNRDDDGGSCLSDDGAYIYRQAKLDSTTPPYGCFLLYLLL